jgi:hypothetical protein
MFTLCSPYLIRTAVVAKRDKTRRKFQEVGVEIYGLRFLESDRQAEPRPTFDPELRDRMRVKRSLDYDLATECSLLSEYYQFTVRDWPCERPELEDAILAGCRNNNSRKARAAPNHGAKEGWADIAVQDL